MSRLEAAALAAFLLSLGGIGSVFIFNPALAWLLQRRRARPVAVGPGTLPSVSLIVVVRNGAALIEEKLRNCLALDYPPGLLEVLVYSDGSTDATVATVGAFAGERVRLLEGKDHQGKHAGMNAAVRQAAGELLIFTDADALLPADALRQLVAPFCDAAVGGACGLRVIAGGARPLERAQRDYVAFDTRIKLLESRAGSLTSNDGKLYAVRRELYREVPPAVTDDLYVALNVVIQRRRFVLAPGATASIRLPSRDLRHELQRRRRIVSTSLRGIWLARAALNPFRHGWYALSLLMNKVLRRLLPLFLLVALASALALSLESRWGLLLLLPQVGFYALAALSPVLARGDRRVGRLGGVAGAAWYFCLGNIGTLLGLVDLLLGRRFSRWEPVKSDG